MAYPFPPTRLIDTTHLPNGLSAFSSNVLIAPTQPFGPSATAFTNLHAVPSLPVSNSPSSLAPLPGPGLPRPSATGAFLGMSDFPPNYKAPMHRTLSLDYCVVMKGELVCVFDSGEETVLREGEVMLQRGTNHQWENRTGEWCRVLFVMLGAEKVVLEGGEVLDQTVIRKPVN